MVIVKLVTTDDQSFELDSDVAYLSKTIAGLMEETDAEVPVQLAISAPILEKVIEWLKYHVAADKKDDNGNPMKSLEEVKNWDTCFVTIGTKVSRAELVDLIKAANYLDIQPLLMTACASLKQDLMQFKDNYQELQKYYQVKGDLTPEEIEEISKEQKWAYD